MSLPWKSYSRCPAAATANMAMRCDTDRRAMIAEGLRLEEEMQALLHRLALLAEERDFALKENCRLRDALDSMVTKAGADFGLGQSEAERIRNGAYTVHQPWCRFCRSSHTECPPP